MQGAACQGGPIAYQEPVKPCRERRLDRLPPICTLGRASLPSFPSKARQMTSVTTSGPPTAIAVPAVAGPTGPRPKLPTDHLHLEPPERLPLIDGAMLAGNPDDFTAERYRHEGWRAQAQPSTG